MLAWVRAWCGAHTGWIEFDPTNGAGPGPDHIVATIGRDYGDIVPIRGVLKTAGSQTTTQAVDVVAI